MDKLTRRLSATFGRYAGNYDSSAEIQKKSSSELFRILARRLPAGSRPGKILEIGCGTGFLSVRLLKAFKPGLLVLNDLSPEMIGLCAKKIPASRSVRYLKGNFMTTAIKGTFDLCGSAMSLQWLENIRAGFRKIRGLLRPGGVLAFSMPVEGTFQELEKSIRLSLGPKTGTGPVPILEFGSPKEIVSSLNRLGFTGIRTRLAITRRSYRNPAEFLRELRDAGLSFPSEKPLPVGVMKKSLRIYSEKFGSKSGAVPATWRIMYAVCRRRDE